jgi:hypothetical protein
VSEFTTLQAEFQRYAVVVTTTAYLYFANKIKERVMFDGLVDILFGWVFDLLYLLMVSICKVIDFLVDIFYKLAGLDTVSVDGNETDLLSHFLESNTVKMAFFGVLLVGIILLCVFVIISIIRSEYAEPNQKKSKSQILTKAGHSLLLFLLVPFVLLAGITLTNVIMSAINSSMLLGVSGGVRASFGGQLLVTSGDSAWIGGANREAIEQGFINGTLDYTNLGLVKKYYHLKELNFLVGIGSGLVLLVLFALSALRFVQRLFDIILLYIVSPVSISTIPIDDGNRFKLWREMLVTKVISAYGIILSMNLFFLIIPQVNKITFYDSNFGNGLIRLLFTIGGAFAVTKAYMVIAQLTGNNGGANEAQQMLAGVSAGARMAKGAYRLGLGGAAQIVGGSDLRKKLGKGKLGSGAKKDDTPKGLDKNSMAKLAGGIADNTKDNKDGSIATPSTNLDKDSNSESNALDTSNTPKSNKALQAMGITGRLATLPLGVLKDVYKKGAMGTAKNLWPRIKNVGGGKGVVNSAKKIDKTENTKT